MKAKSFLKLLITFILTFGLTSMCVLVAYICTSGGTIFGYEFTPANQMSHINTMLMGLDKDGTRTDVMILAQLNMVDDEINMLQIPRDTYVKDNGRGDRKINSAYGANKEKSVFSEVKKVTGIDVNKYVLVDISGFRDLIDTIGGVDFDVPQDMDYDDPYQDLHIHLKKGMQHLDGDKAEQLVRYRSYPDGDIGRMRVQSKFIQAVIDKLFSFVNVFRLNDLVEDFSKIVKTNFTLNEMLTYAPYVFSTPRDQISTHQLAGEARYVGGVSYVIPDYDANDNLRESIFTPSNASSAKSQMELEEGIVGLDSISKRADSNKAEASLLNRFVSVELIDASGGNADVGKLRKKLIEYGYNVRGNTQSTKAVFEETVVVSRTISARAAAVAFIAGCKEYIYNPVKETSSDITIIIGN